MGLISTYLLWGPILLLQNFSFMFVSRARNSGSIKRHTIASFFSNAIWFVSQLFIFSQMFKIMKGDYGIGMAVFTALFYTGFTMTGSLLAHFYALRNEKGSGAVGANKKFAQFTADEGAILREVATAFTRIKEHTAEVIDPVATRIEDDIDQAVTALRGPQNAAEATAAFGYTPPMPGQGAKL